MPNVKKRRAPALEGPPRQKPKFQYSEESMKLALDAVRGGLPTRAAAKQFGVPFSTLQYKVKGKSPEERRMGPQTMLTKNEEELIVRYIVANAKKGFPLNRRILIETVQNIVTSDGRTTKFRNNRPGKKWLKSFFRRHPEITERNVEAINRGRGVVTEEKIRAWGDELKRFLEEENASEILDSPERIFNADESGFRTNPDTGKVLGPVNYKNMYEVKDGSEKESITSLLTTNANGELAPPLVVYPYVRIPKAVAQNVNPEWALGRSTSGWMTGQVFFCYLGNVFIPWLQKNNIKMPILLLIDGHKSHLTLNVCKLCKANGIILFALLPNATHILQPLDVSVFKPLKDKWKQVVEDWRRTSKTRVLTKVVFPGLLEKVIEERATDKIIKNGFRKCGIFPFDMDAIDFTKCMNHESRFAETTEAENDENFVSAKPTSFQVEHILYLESCMKGGRAEEFRECEVRGWEGEESAKELFEVWRKLRKRCMVNQAKIQEKVSEELESENEGVVNEDTNEEPSQVQENDVVVEDVVDAHFTTTPTKEQCPSSNPDKVIVTPVKMEACKLNISPAFLSNIVWPTESPGKKPTKNPRPRLPHAATGSKWMDFWEEKEKEKARPKKKKGVTDANVTNPKAKKIVKKKKKDWICATCKGSWADDVEMANGRKWFGPCTSCAGWYHKQCLSKRLVTEFALDDLSDDDEEADFVCDGCFGNSDDDLAMELSEDDE